MLLTTAVKISSQKINAERPVGAMKPRGLRLTAAKESGRFWLRADGGRDECTGGECRRKDLTHEQSPRLCCRPQTTLPVSPSRGIVQQTPVADPRSNHSGSKRPSETNAGSEAATVWNLVQLPATQASDELVKAARSQQ